MLSFFYRRKKLVLVLICFIMTILIAGGAISEFCLESLNTRTVKKKKNQELAFITPKGQKVNKYFFDDFVKFLSKEIRDFSGDFLGWNFFNDGVITRYFITPDNSEEIFLLGNTSSYKDFWLSKIAKEKSFSLYAHPEASFISMDSIWLTYAKELRNSYREFLLQEDIFSKKFLQLRKRIFLEEKKFPSYMVRQILLQQEKLYSLKKDPFLTQEDKLKLFGYSSLSDWFGSNFVENVAKIIISVVEEAKEKGVKVSFQELDKGIEEKKLLAFSFLKDKVPHLSSKEDMFYSYLNGLDIDERSFKEIYKNILIFQKFLSEETQRFIFDFYSLKDLVNYGNETVSVKVIGIEKDLMFTSIDELEKFEAYLEAIQKGRRDLFLLPKNTLSLEELKKTAPNFLGKRLSLDYSHVDLNSLGSTLSIQEIMSWKEIPENQKKLQETYPELLIYNKDKKLPKNLEKEINNFIAKTIYKKDISRVESILKNKEKKKEEIIFSLTGKSSFLNIDNFKEFSSFLEEKKQMNIYSTDGVNYYSFYLNKPCEETLLTFKELCGLGYLESSYSIKEKVIEVLSSIQKKYGLSSLNEALNYRWASLLENYQDWSNLDLPFKIFNMRREKIKRKNDFLFVLNDLKENKSKIYYDASNGLHTYVLLKNDEKESLPIEGLFHLQAGVEEELTTHYLNLFVRNLPKDFFVKREL